MAKVIVLDSGPLGMVSHPKANKEIAVWFIGLVQSGAKFIVPEVADYEVRRELIRAGLNNSVNRLNQLKEKTLYLPISTEAMLRAATIWAEARNSGQQTADDKALDGDVILAAQTLTLRDAEDPVIATDNVAHLARYATARHWKDIS